MTSPSVGRSRAATILLWIGTVIGGSIALSGVGKFTSHFWQPLFVGWGYPAWFASVVGAAEVVAGVSLFIPRLAAWAASVLALIMGGAFVTLLTHPSDKMGWGATPLFYLVIVGLVGAVRWRDRVRPGAT